MKMLILLLFISKTLISQNFDEQVWTGTVVDSMVELGESRVEWKTTARFLIEDDYLWNTYAYRVYLLTDIFSRSKIIDEIKRVRFRYVHSYLFKSYIKGLEMRSEDRGRRNPYLGAKLAFIGFGATFGYIARKDPEAAFIGAVVCYFIGEIIIREIN